MTGGIDWHERDCAEEIFSDAVFGGVQQHILLAGLGIEVEPD